MLVCSSNHAVLFLWQELNLQLDNKKKKKMQSEKRYEMREAKMRAAYYLVKLVQHIMWV